jgi:hypothetical protein
MAGLCPEGFGMSVTLLAASVATGANRQFPQAGLAPARALHLSTARRIKRVRDAHPAYVLHHTGSSESSTMRRSNCTSDTSPRMVQVNGRDATQTARSIDLSRRVHRPRPPSPLPASRERRRGRLRRSAVAASRTLSFSIARWAVAALRSRYPLPDRPHSKPKRFHNIASPGRSARPRRLRPNRSKCLETNPTLPGMPPPIKTRCETCRVHHHYAHDQRTAWHRHL